MQLFGSFQQDFNCLGLFLFLLHADWQCLIQMWHGRSAYGPNKQKYVS